MEKDSKKELAKLKREAVEIAGKIHDVVEDTLWVDYVKLPELSEELRVACEKVKEFEKANS